MAKQRGGNRTVFISIFVILAIAGIIVGVLFATGVLGKKSNKPSSPPTPPGPIPPGPPAPTCEGMPTVQSFTRNAGGQTARLTFTPISNNCVTGKSWMVYYSITTDTFPPRTGESSQSFNAFSGQTYVDIPWEASYKPNDPVTGYKGQAWLQAINSDGPGDLQYSNKVPYLFMN